MDSSSDCYTRTWGNQDHDSYALFKVSDLANTGFDYWALGHVHTRQTLRETGPTIVYPRNPQAAIQTSQVPEGLLGGSGRSRCGPAGVSGQ